MRSYQVGALPIINHVLERMNLEEILEAHLPQEDGRTTIPTRRGVLLLVRNILIAREPLYGLGEWASRYAPDLLGLDPEQVTALNDDRSGRWLTRFFASDPATIGLAVTTRSVHQFDVALEEWTASRLSNHHNLRHYIITIIERTINQIPLSGDAPSRTNQQRDARVKE